jgi:hypothetical protein
MCTGEEKMGKVKTLPSWTDIVNLVRILNLKPSTGYVVLLYRMRYYWDKDSNDPRCELKIKDLSKETTINERKLHDMIHVLEEVKSISIGKKKGKGVNRNVYRPLYPWNLEDIQETANGVSFKNCKRGQFLKLQTGSVLKTANGVRLYNKGSETKKGQKQRTFSLREKTGKTAREKENSSLSKNLSSKKKDQQPIQSSEESCGFQIPVDAPPAMARDKVLRHWGEPFDLLKVNEYHLYLLTDPVKQMVSSKAIEINPAIYENYQYWYQEVIEKLWTGKNKPHGGFPKLFDKLFRLGVLYHFGFNPGKNYIPDYLNIENHDGWD